MGEEKVQESLRAVRGEVEAALAGVDPTPVAALAEAVAAARAIFVTGEGRSGLIARALAMRLMQLGRLSYVPGETTTPAAGPGDLVIAISKSGHTGVVEARLAAARAVGARVAMITAAPEQAPASALSVVLPLPPSGQFGGSLFEQVALLVMDALVLVLQARLGVSAAEMATRHATLE